MLVAGQLERRRRKKRVASEHLRNAAAEFEEMGARLWAERAKAELRRVGLRRSAPDELTESERRVAELAASGLKNREVAAQLFLSPKTVEATLARVYRKLEIHSRAELGARLGGHTTATDVGKHPLPRGGADRRLARMMGTDAPGTYLVECYWPAITRDQHAAAAGRARAAAGEARGVGRQLQFLGSILIPADETVFSLFAGCEDDVRAASQRAGLPFERVLESVPSGLAVETEGHQAPGEALQRSNADRRFPTTSGGKRHA